MVPWKGNSQAWVPDDSPCRHTFQGSPTCWSLTLRLGQCSCSLSCRQPLLLPPWRHYAAALLPLPVPERPLLATSSTSSSTLRALGICARCSWFDR